MAIRMRKKWLAALAAATISAPLTFGLGLGEVTIHSKLNQPLDAEIEITSATSDELSALYISVPKDEVFERYDIERLAVFSNLRFKVKDGRSGNQVIHITSRDVIQDPFLTFLVEANWAQGRMLREYTVLVDPPLFIPTPTTTEVDTKPYVAPAATYSRDTSNNQGSISRAESITPVRQSSYREGEAYQVRRGDTLSQIAKRVNAGSNFTVNQTMMAIYRNNTQAFNGNINRLKAGYELNIPSSTEVSRITTELANQEVNSQIRTWRGTIDTSLSSYKPKDSSSSSSTTTTSGSSATDSALDKPLTSEGKLELKVPDLESGLGDGTGGDSSSGLDAEGEQRIRELQTKVSEFERLLAAKDNELAALQAQLDKGYKLSTDTSLNSEGGTAVSDLLNETRESLKNPKEAKPEETDLTDTFNNDPFATPDEPVVSADVIDASTVEADKPEPPKVKAPQEESSGLMSMLIKGAIGLLGLGLLGLLGFFGYRKFNKGPSRDTLFVDDDLDVTAESIAEKVKNRIENKNKNLSSTSEIEVGETSFEDAGIAPALGFNVPAEDEADVDFNFSDDTASATQETEAISISQSIEAPPPHLAESIESDEALPFDDTTLADVGTGSMQLDQNDPLAETDFHMAYGLYDQAAELMQTAIQENDSFAFKEKLLEVFFVSGNKEEFLRYAKEIKDEAIDRHSGTWDSIVIMGKQLAPEEDLFSGDVSTAGLDDGLDFKLGETGNIEIDSSLFNELSAAENVGADMSAVAEDDSMDFSLDIDGSAEGADAADFSMDLDIEEANLSEVATEVSVDDDDVIDLDMDLVLPDAPVDLEEVIEDFNLDLNATLNGTEVVTLDAEEASEEISPLADWDNSTHDLEHELTEITPALAEKLEQMEENTLTTEFNVADLDMDIGSATETSLIPDLDLASGQADQAMDLDLSELGLNSAADSIFESEDVSEETLDFAFDLDKSDDIEIEADLPFSEDALDNTQGVGVDILDGLNSDGEGTTKKMEVDNSLDFLLDDSVDDTTNAALDLDLETMFSDNSGDPFPDDTLQSMLPDGVSENDSGTMQLNALDAGDNFAAQTRAEILNLDDDMAETAQITEAELAAMGLSDNGPDFMGTTGMSFDNASDVDEASTKLDLARAYIEMDDPDNAKSILQEVIDDGNDSQRNEAKDILLTLS